MASNPTWTFEDLAREVCNVFVAKGLLREKPPFIRTDREARLVGIFRSVGLDGAKMQTIENQRTLEVLVRQGAQGEVWVEDVIHALAGMQPNLITTPATHTHTEDAMFNEQSALEKNTIHSKSKLQSVTCDKVDTFLRNIGHSEERVPERRPAILAPQSFACDVGERSFSTGYRVPMASAVFASSIKAINLEAMRMRARPRLQVTVVLPSGSATTIKLGEQTRGREKLPLIERTVMRLRVHFTDERPPPPGKTYKFLKGNTILDDQCLLEDGDTITAVATDETRESDSLLVLHALGRDGFADL